MNNTARTIIQSAVALCFVVPLLTGCDLVDRFNSQFQDKLSVAMTPPIAEFNTKLVSSDTYQHVSVVDARGTSLELSPDNKPILFVAYWCPHCQRTLALFSKHLPAQKMPVIVSLGFVPGTSLSFAKKVTHEEMVTLELPESNLLVDYALSGQARDYVKDGYPTLVFVHNGQLLKLVGEHTWSVWSHAISEAGNS